MTDKVSIIIRTKNEERWISSCLREVFNQEYPCFEVILVDNNSADKTVEKAQAFPVRKILTIDGYRPGKALNAGIREATGNYVVSISAHCIPVGSRWLSALLRNFHDRPDIGAVYGRQEPMSYSSDADKRDMLTVFGLDHRIQEKDSFFHNANSAFRRSLWDRIPFNDEVTNIEDRLWAEDIIKAGYKIAYEPEASVMHYHGIHHTLDPKRCSNVVSILESIPSDRFRLANNHLNIEKMNVVAVIPVIGEILRAADRPLLEYTIERARQARYVSKVIVSTDSPEIADLAVAAGAEAPFLRDPAFSRDDVPFEKVLRHSLERIEAGGVIPDLLVSMEITYPFRPPDLIDQIILHLVKGGFDTVLPARSEYNTCWVDGKGEFRRVDGGLSRRKFRHAVRIGIKGLGCVTHPFLLRNGALIGDRVGLLDIDDWRMPIEIRDSPGAERAGELLAAWDELFTERLTPTASK